MNWQYPVKSSVLWPRFTNTNLFMRSLNFRFALLLSLYLIPALQGKLTAQKVADQKVVSGTVLLNEKKAPDGKAMVARLNSSWKLKTDSINISDKTLIFNTTGGATVMIAYLDYPAAMDEIGAAARLSWIWKTANTETFRHQAQVVISVIGASNHSLDLYKIFTQTAAAVLEETHAPGINMDAQYLLLSAGYYTAAARNMVQNQTIPLYCWVYFGRPGGGNGFTYGLSEFGLSEMEIVNSAHSEAEVHATLYDSAMSVLKYGTKIQDGQSVTTEEGDKWPVHLKKGTYLPEQMVLNLEY